MAVQMVTRVSKSAGTFLSAPKRLGRSFQTESQLLKKDRQKPDSLILAASRRSSDSCSNCCYLPKGNIPILMVDRQVRDILAEAIRHFVARLSGNYEFDDAAFSVRTEDRRVRIIREQIWGIYDNPHEHKLDDDWALSDEQGEIVHRVIMFLKSDAEYRWPRSRRGIDLHTRLSGLFRWRHLCQDSMRITAESLT